MISLTANQAAAVTKLSRLRCGALFMRPGSGKTRAVLTLLQAKQAGFDTVIWIAPSSLLANESYMSEIDSACGDLQMVFFTTESIGSSNRRIARLYLLAKTCACACVIDESSKTKNPLAKRVRRLLILRSLFTYRFILNGTPVMRSIHDLWAQMEFLSPKILRRDERQFAHDFLIYKKEGGHRPWTQWSKPQNEEALIEIIRPYIFDADLDIAPTVKRKKIDLRLSDEEAYEYACFKKQYLSRQFVPSFFEVQNSFQHQYTLTDSKLRWLCEFVKRGEKAIVFVRFLHEVDAIRERFACYEYTGRHKDELCLFKGGDRPLLVMTYGTGALGLNIQFVRHVIFFSQTFDWGHREQGVHRAYRIGQNSDVYVCDLVLNTGLDRIMQRSCHKKQTTADNVSMLINFVRDQGIGAL
ncbi:MAG: SNF2-related protein [Pseudomonadota bacterium]